MIMDVGRVCRKVRGADSGQYCVVIERPRRKADRNFVTIEGERIKRQRVNIGHIEPLPVVLSISGEITREEIIEALKSNNFINT